MSEQALRFEVHAHVDAIDDRPRVRHELCTAVLLGLRDKGIELRTFGRT